jgi:glycosyltransferase involved in cell wall biosynthesis
MKIAIIVDSLVEFGGAERVLIALREMFPQVHVFTSVVNNAFKKRYFGAMVVKTIAIPQNFSAQHTSLFQSLSPVLWQSLDLRGYDVVVAISGHMMSNFVNTGHAIFIQYLLTPPKNIYFQEPETNFQRVFPYQMYVRPAYENALRKTPYLLTLSHHMQHVFHATCGVDPVVIYPPVNIPDRLPQKRKGKYYLIVSRLERSKSIELAIEACNKRKEQLYIVGVTNEQRYERYLRSIAGNNIHFCGYQSDEAIHSIYKEAKAFLFTAQNEDFGIAPIEAMAHGVPVVAYYGGGTKETVVDGKTGTFFFDHTPEALIAAMNKNESRHFLPSTLWHHAQAFSDARFKRNIRQYITKVRASLAAS